MIEAVRYISLISWYRLKQRGNSRRNATAPVVSQFLESPVEVHGRKSGVPCTPARHIDKIERELGGPQVVSYSEFAIQCRSIFEKGNVLILGCVRSPHFKLPACVRATNIFLSRYLLEVVKGRLPTYSERKILMVRSSGLPKHVYPSLILRSRHSFAAFWI
jgi:hypothetical protein